jgi:hypothetical protein
VADPRGNTVVLGAGPVGCMAALAAARTGPVILHAARDNPGQPRVDSVPSPLLALLLEFGVHPAEIGVTELQDTRTASWESRDPVVLRTRAMAHVMRPELDLALRRKVLRSPAVTIVPTLDPYASRTAARVIDASGRTAVSAVRRVRPTEPFVARIITATGQFSRAARAFQLAAMPDGYVYRVGTSALLTFGIVAPKRSHHVSVECKLRQLGLGWILTGLPPLETMAAGRSGIASVQWSEGPHHPIRVGDAALARDSLSSQGMANGLSDALQAFENETGLWRRHKEERQAHLASLIREIERCWCGSSSSWMGYQTFLRGHLNALDAVAVKNRIKAEHEAWDSLGSRSGGGIAAMDLKPVPERPLTQRRTPTTAPNVPGLT